MSLHASFWPWDPFGATANEKGFWSGYVVVRGFHDYT